jgi:hypothetical protein
MESCHQTHQKVLFGGGACSECLINTKELHKQQLVLVRPFCFRKIFGTVQFFSSHILSFFSFAKDENISVSSVKEHEYLDELFNTPLSEEAFQQFCELQILVQSIDLNNNLDTCTYIWGQETFLLRNAIII